MVATVLAQQVADLAEMTGGFIHDMKNHLGTVLLNLDLLAEDFEDLRKRSGNAGLRSESA